MSLALEDLKFVYRLVYAQICDRFVYKPSTCVCTLQTVPRDLMSVSSDAAVKLESSVGRFNGFQVERVLGESDRTKFVAVLGRYAELENARDLQSISYETPSLLRWTSKPDQAVVLLSRRPFDTAGVQGLLETSLESELLFQNDVYCKV